MNLCIHVDVVGPVQRDLGHVARSDLLTKGWALTPTRLLPKVSALDKEVDDGGSDQERQEAGALPALREVARIDEGVVVREPGNR